MAAAIWLCFASHTFAIEYTFEKIIDAPSNFQHIYGPSLNDHGAMAFNAFLTDGTIGVYGVTPAGDLVTIADNTHGFSVAAPLEASINNSNTVAFLGRRSGDSFDAIYRRFYDGNSYGEPIVFTQTSAEGSIQSLQAPWISNSNGIVYVASLRPTEEDPVARTALMRGSLPVVTGPAATTSFDGPDINSIDSVVAMGSDGLYLNSNVVYQDSGSSAAINDAGTVAFFNNGDEYGIAGIYTGDGVSEPMLYAASQSGTGMGDPDINNQGLIAYIDHPFGGAETIFVGPAHERLLSPNALFGSGVNSVSFFRGLNNHGQIAFGYQLSNGQRGIALATPRDPAVLGNGDFNNGFGLFDVVYDEEFNGVPSIANVAGDPRLQMTIENGVIGLRQGMETTGDPYSLQFDFDWLTTAGSLEVHVNDILALTLGADGSVSSDLGSPTITPLGDLNRLSLEFTPAPLAEGYIRFDLHPGSEATIQIDKISFAPLSGVSLPGDYNGNGLVEQADLDLVLGNWGTDAAVPPDGWVNDLPSGIIDQGELDGVLSNWGRMPASAVATAAVPEPSIVALFSLCGLALLWCRRRERRRNASARRRAPIHLLGARTVAHAAVQPMCILLAALAALAALAPVATAAERTWVGDDGIWVDRPARFIDPNWSSSNEPDPNDEAIFDDDVSVTMSGANSVQALTMSGGIDLSTNDSGLAVTELVELEGDGTNLIVSGGGSILQADAITVNSGADIHLEGGTLLTVGSPAAGGIDVNIGGEITGYGLIFLGDQVASPTTVLTLDGELTAVGPIGIPGTSPSAGTLRIIGNGSNSRLNLDGAGGGGDGIVNVNRNATLDIDVPLSDIFDGTMNLGASATLDIASLWGLNGTLNVNSGASGAIIPLPAVPAHIAGLQLIGYLNGAIILDQADEVLVLDVPYVGAATINNSGTIEFNAPASIQANFLMTGPHASLTVHPGITVNVSADDFDLGGNGTATNITTIGADALLNVAGDPVDVKTGVLNLNGGTLNFDVADDNWVLGGTVNVGVDTGLSQIGGDAVTFGANTTVGEFATLQFNAPITVSSSTVVVNTGANLVLGRPITFNNAPGLITGPGTVTQAHNATVIGNSGITVSTYDWDGGSTTVNPGVTFTLDVDHIDTGGQFTNDTHNNTININSGTVDVTVADGEWELGVAGDLNFNDTTSGSLPTLQGSRLRVVAGGRIDVDGGAVIHAPLILEEGSTLTIGGDGGTVDLNAQLTLQGGDLVDDIDRITQDARVNVEGGLAVTGTSTVDVKFFNWDEGPTVIGPFSALTMLADRIEEAGTPQQYDSTLTINSGTLLVDILGTTWIMDGTLNLRNTQSREPTISGDVLQIGDDVDDVGAQDAFVTVGGGSGHSVIESRLRFKADSHVDIAAGATLNTKNWVFFDSVNGATNAQFTGAGTWLFGNAVFFDEATTINMPAGTVDLDGGPGDTDGGQIRVDVPVVLNLATLHDFGNPSGNNVFSIANSGRLQVNLTNPGDEWTVNSTASMTYDGDAVNDVFLAGADVNFNGVLSVRGKGQIDARLDLGMAHVVIGAATPGELTLNGGLLFDPNTLSGGSIGGDLLRLNPGRALVGFGEISADVAAAGSAELRAANGTLMVTGTIIDVNFLGTANELGVLNMFHPWNTNVAGVVELLGGQLTGNEIINDGVIQGFGLIEVEQLINNSRITATFGGTLLLDRHDTIAGYDWDGNDEDGILEALGGDLTLRAGMPFTDFDGTMNIGLGRVLFVDGFELSHDQFSTINLTGGIYRGNMLQTFRGTLNASIATSEIDSPGTFLDGSLNNLNADLQLRQSMTINAGATFSGAGKLINLNGATLKIQDGANIGVELENQGMLAPGCSPGQATVEAYTQTETGILEIELGGTGANDIDRLIVTGQASLAGTLDLSLIDGFVPSSAETFDFLSAAGGIFGAFDTINLPSLPLGLSWEFDVSHPTMLQLFVIERLPGDYNDNGLVEQADLDLVLTNWGADATEPPAGWINNLPTGFVDQAELDRVLSSWGQTAAALGPSAAVPEPASLFLGIGTALLLAAVGRRREK